MHTFKYSGPVVRGVATLGLALALSVFVLAANSHHHLGAAKDLGPGQSPNLIVDANGNVDLSFLQTGTAGNVMFARSMHGRSTFDVDPVTTPGPVFSVAMGVDGQGAISLLWEDGKGGTFFGNSINGGKKFLLTDISRLFSNGSTPQLNVSASGLIDLSQLSRGMGRIGIISLVLTDRGTKSGTPVLVASNASDVVFSDVAAVGAQGQIYVAWQMQSEVVPECAIMFSRSLDGGMTFSAPLNVSNNPNECGQFPQLFVDSADRVNIAWTTVPGFSDNNGTLVNPNELFFARSTDQGATFSKPTALVGINQFTGLGDDFSGVGDPQIAVERDGAIDVVFDANTPTDMMALFARSTDGGTTFSTPVTLATGGASTPTVAIDGCGGINVVWAGTTGIFLSRSTDGSMFTTPTNLSNANQVDFNPLIVTDVKGSAFIVWEDSTDVFFQRVKVCPGNF